MTVVDASVWVSRLVPQDMHHSASHDWLEQHVAGGGLLVAPVLLLTEVAGAISRRTGDPELARRSWQGLLRLRALRLVPLDRRLANLAAGLAADQGLRGADAAYVAVAQQLRLPLVTWDRDQQERASKIITVRTPETAS